MPADKPVIVAVVPAVFQRYVYGEVPPEGEAVAVPSLWPQSSSVDTTETIGAPEEVKTTERVSSHPSALVAITVYVPPIKLVRS